MKLSIDQFIKDKHGHIVLWQTPNVLLYSWIVLKVVTWLLSTSHLKSGLGQLSTAILFAWAYLEATKGVNYFRKLLGAVVLGMIVIGFFRG
jgi:hypothetical protein